MGGDEGGREGSIRNFTNTAPPMMQRAVHEFYTL